MSDATIVAVDFDDGLPIPPLDSNFFSLGDDQNDVVPLEDLDFDFSFDDLCSDGLDGFLDPVQFPQPDPQPDSDPNFAQFGPEFDQFPHLVFKSTSPELLRHLSGDNSGDRSSEVLNTDSPVDQVSGYLNVASPESNGSNRGDEKALDCHSPESQGSGHFGSDVSEDSNNRSVSSSRNSNIGIGVVDQKVKLESPVNNSANSSVLMKRKKENDDVIMNNSHVESRMMNNKCRKSNSSAENNANSVSSDGPLSEEEEKRKARLMRNRESAQLSRQRKKHYVEELEDKVRNMHSTIQDLNAKISYFMAENATLRQQVGGAGGGSVPPPAVAAPPPPPGMYPHPAMMYPWMPYPPPYMMKPQGSQVPLVPIPRLKPQQPAQAPKTSKKVESKKQEGTKTKKVAGVSFLGLLFFIMLFGGLVPIVNVRYGGVRESFTGGESYVGGGFYDKHRGRVLMVNGTDYGEKHGGRSSGDEPNPDEFRVGNGSEPLVASLYVPRNDKLVKIDGNLIIHSVLASEKAMASGKGGEETGLVVPRGDLARAIPVSGVARHPHLRALPSGADRDNVKSTASDGRLQQWFREGLAGPMLSSGMCTEVFQFDVSSAIVPASRNITGEKNQNSTHLSKGRNRRILHGLPIPLPESSHNISREQTGRNPQKENLNISDNASSMVVSVLVDPREASDADVDGVMGTKSISRIFVVVLIDSVKYVTYSCMLPFLGSIPHLVTT